MGLIFIFILVTGCSKSSPIIPAAAVNGAATLASGEGPLYADMIVNLPTHLHSVDDMLANAKRNLELRDSWASAFYNSYLLAAKILPTFVNLESSLDTPGCLKN